LEELRNLFHRHPHFCGMPPEDQLKVAGLLKDQEPNYQWFGSMWGAGHFKHAIKVNDPAVSTALDAIPLRGPVDRAAYNRFVNTLRRAFPKGGMNVGVVSRLLAMKRPDLFVCLDKKNKQKLTEAFAIPKSVDCDDYWDCIVQRIQDSTWWQTSRPEVADQKRIWDGRAAMLDALFYQR